MKIDGILVVEGKSDVAFLSNFIEAEFVTTNGSEISKSTIEYLKEVSKSKKIYVLTDPDFPGERIRKVLDENIPNLTHCFIKKENAIKHGKVGVAESNKEEILNSLKNAVTFSETMTSDVKMSDLVRMNLTGNDDSRIKREKICEVFHLGHCNAKTLLKRINNCGIKLEEIEKAL